MSSLCQFEFNHENRVYFSGDAVKVVIHLTTTKEKTVEEIYIRFLGEAQVHWLLPHSTKYYENSENYVDCRRVVHNVGDGPTLTPGRRTFTFHIKIPPFAASTCHEEYGSVCYTCKLVLKRSNRYDNEFIEPFTVLRQLKITEIPDLSFPVHDVRVRTLSCWPCINGPVLTTLLLPSSFYAAGEHIKFNIDVDNSSRCTLRFAITSELLQHFYFIHQSSPEHSKNSTKTIESSELQINCVGQSCERMDITLNIPTVPPTTPDGLIFVYYTLKILMKCGNMSMDQLFHIPVVIGTNGSSNWYYDATDGASMQMQGRRFTGDFGENF